MDRWFINNSFCVKGTPDILKTVNAFRSDYHPALAGNENCLVKPEKMMLPLFYWTGEMMFLP